MTTTHWIAAEGVGVYLSTGSKSFHPDFIANRERESFNYWFSLDDEEKKGLMKTVVTELERLIENVESWLPAGMAPDGREKPLDIVIRIWPEHTVPRSDLSKTELQEAEEVIQSLRGILDD